MDLNVENTSNPQHIEVNEQVKAFAKPFTQSYLVFLLLFFAGRYWVNRRSLKQLITISYREGQEVAVAPGTNLLEASLQAEIPHAHVCGGRGRCSTCRVQIVEGWDSLSSMTSEEEELLARVQAGPQVRLACRTVPQGYCKIYPILPPDVTTKDAFRKKAHSQGSDQEIAVLFSDLRGFTSFTENKLPYDVVYMLNQYFQFMGQAIEAEGGMIDKFVGDGIMALFGIEEGVEKGCQNALRAAKAMAYQLDNLNNHLSQELKKPLRMGIGIHCGPVIVGELGYNQSINLTAIGDATNTASRLENATKEYNCQLIVSEDVTKKAGVDFSQFSVHDIEIRGKTKPLCIYEVKDAKEVML